MIEYRIYTRLTSDENKNMSIIFEISTRADLVCITVSKYR